MSCFWRAPQAAKPCAPSWRPLCRLGLEEVQLAACHALDALAQQDPEALARSHHLAKLFTALAMPPAGDVRALPPAVRAAVEGLEQV